jgi:hypothetical protein
LGKVGLRKIALVKSAKSPDCSVHGCASYFCFAGVLPGGVGCERGRMIGAPAVQVHRRAPKSRSRTLVVLTTLELRIRITKKSKIAVFRISVTPVSRLRYHSNPNPALPDRE